jgi:NADH dehydrogenase (ubiquinone) Fe-S protein 6
MIRLSRNVRNTNLLLKYARSYGSSSAVPETGVPETAIGSQQAPNRATTWSASQQTRAQGQQGPRFEQTDLSLQPQPYAAIDLIAKEPIRFVDSDVAVCDGGRGAQGHPKVFINIDKPGAHTCLYCKSN